MNYRAFNRFYEWNKFPSHQKFIRTKPPYSEELLKEFLFFTKMENADLIYYENIRTNKPRTKRIVTCWVRDPEHGHEIEFYLKMSVNYEGDFFTIKGDCYDLCHKKTGTTITYINPVFENRHLMDIAREAYDEYMKPFKDHDDLLNSLNPESKENV